jgi:BlaI family penicillinase repressor
MTMVSRLPELSRAELDIMKWLWKEGKLSARELHDRLTHAYEWHSTDLTKTYDWAYSTTRTTMDRMVKKGLLARREFHGLYLYEPLISRPMGLAQAVRDFADRVLEVDYGTVVSMFARSKALTPEEIDELHQLLEPEKKES